MAGTVRSQGIAHSLSAMRGIPLRSAPAVLAVGLSLVLGATACGPPGEPPGPGGTTTPGPAGTTATPSPAGTAPAFTEDCYTYDAQVLTKSYAAGVWVIRPDHGEELIRVHGGPADGVGDRALAVAKHWNTICYIGRGNPFNNPDFVFEYWRDQSDFYNTPWPNPQGACGTYNFNTLQVENMGGGLGWRVTDGTRDLQHFASQQDANNGRTVLTNYDELCKIDSETPSPDVHPADITYNLHL